MQDEETFDIAVIGAGAAGLMASIFAGSGGARVLLLESTPNGGRKILISGGGRCNVLPSSLHPDEYVTASSRNTLKKMLLSWPLAEQRRYFEEELGVPLALEKESGKLFPVSNVARDVRAALVEKAARAGVSFGFESAVNGLDPVEPGWRIRHGRGEVVARRVVMATGGLSVPKTGSDGAGLRLLAELGHTIHRTYPALTPLISEPPVHGELAGISLEARIAAPSPGGPYESRGGFLFTHRGYSGPAVLNVSHLASTHPGQELLVSWGDRDSEAWLRELTAGGGKSVISVLRRHLPTRLADRLLSEAGITLDRSTAQLRREERKELLRILVRYPLPWTGDEGYRKAEVTGGGVALGEVDPLTLESKLHPGLHLCGELLDAFGPIGGYNFVWAWSTGRAAGRGAAVRR